MSKAWWQYRPFEIVCVFDVLCVFAVIAIMTLPALAAVAIPIPLTRYVIDLGDLPPWIMAFIVVVTWYEARTAKKHALASAKALAIISPNIDKISVEIDGMRTAAEAAKFKEGGEKVREDIAAAKNLERTEAVADAEAKAKVRIAEAAEKPKGK